MFGQTLKDVDHQPYLGVTISGTLDWKTHIFGVKIKANETLRCIKRNLHSCPERVKAQAYISFLVIWNMEVMHWILTGCILKKKLA